MHALHLIEIIIIFLDREEKKKKKKKRNWLLKQFSSSIKYPFVI